MDYIPESEDIVEHLPALVGGDVDVVAEELGVTAERIRTLLRSSPEAYDLIRAAESEFVALVRLRAMLLLPEALDALEGAMAGRMDGKTAMAAVRAAAEVMDRTVMPKITRAAGDTRTVAETRALPDLGELLQGAEKDDADAIIAKYMATLDDLDALRNGKVVEGEAEVIK
jgi:hypothetical protein